LQFASNIKGSSGTGSDTINAAAATAAVVMSTAASGSNTLTGSSTIGSTITSTAATGVDTVFGGTGADTVSVGGGADFIYANNAGNKQVATVTYATTNATAGATFTVSIGGVATVFTDAAGNLTIDAIAAGVRDAINANTAVNKMTVATSAAGVVTLTNIVDGVITVASAETSAGTTVADLVTGAGTSLTTGADVMTGGAGADTFYFGISNAAPSASALQTITDFNTGAVTDFVFYTPAAAAIASTIATATAGVAKITAAGIATFTSADSTTLALSVAAVAGGIQAGAGGTVAGEAAVFQFGSDAYLFISNGTDGVNAGDVLVKLTGISTTDTATDTLTVSGHTFTLA
jgi:hypothetical protein